MIDRFVFVRLKEEYASERAAIAAYSAQTLRALPGVVQVTVGTPADAHAEAAWDLSIRVRFAALDDVEPYRMSPAHRRYVDEYLAPRMAVIKAWSFQVDA
jgi:hypothetical protein